MPPTEPHEPALTSETALLGAALALGAREVPGWSPAETALARALDPSPPAAAVLRRLRARIAAGADPLGRRSAGCARPGHGAATAQPTRRPPSSSRWWRGPPARARPRGWSTPARARAGSPSRPGGASPSARIVGVELDPLAAAACRAHLAAAGLADRSRVEVADFRSADAGAAPPSAPTLYLGNPPYVRHHQIPAGWKEWLALTARAHGLEASRLAGLHVHFFLATAARARPGDRGAFITSSEWLDTNYGRLVRELLLDGLGGEAIHVVEPTAVPFEDAAVTAAITCFRAGRRPGAVRMRRVADVRRLGALEGGRPVPAERLREARRWSPLTRGARRPRGPHPARRPREGAPGRRHGAQLHVGRAAGRDGPAARGALPVGHARAGDLRGGLGPVVHRPPAPGRRPAAGPRRLLGARAAAHRGLPRPGAARRRARGLHRPGAATVVVGGPAGAGADPRHLHGAPAAGLHPQPGRCPPHQHRARPLPPGGAPPRRRSSGCSSPCAGA